MRINYVCKFNISKNSQNVAIPYNMQRAMATEAETTREVKAKIIIANGEKVNLFEISIGILMMKYF